MSGLSQTLNDLSRSTTPPPAPDKAVKTRPVQQTEAVDPKEWKNPLGSCEQGIIMKFFQTNVAIHERLKLISDSINNLEKKQSPFAISLLKTLVAVTSTFVADNLNDMHYQFREHVELHDHCHETATQTEECLTSISTQTLADRDPPVLENSQAKPCQISDISISKLLCPCCSEQSHRLEDCVRFQSLKRHERSTVLRNQRICFDCLDGFHRTQICPDPGICSICNL